MIECVHRNKKYQIYMTKEEADNAGVRVVPVEEAQIGDYVLSINCYYVPVVNRGVMTRLRAGKIQYYICLTFPGRKSHAFMLHKPKSFNYDPYKIETPKSRLSIQERAMINMMEQGMTFFECVSFALNKPINQATLELIRLINKADFAVIAKEYIMNNLIVADENIITSEYLIAKLKAIVEDKDEHPTIRKQAIVTLENLLAKQPSIPKFQWEKPIPFDTTKMIQPNSAPLMLE